MKVVALISGGKDSCCNMMQCVAEGHEIIALANLYPAKQTLSSMNGDELDSYMYQSVGHDGIELYAEVMQLPLYRRAISGKPLVLNKSYLPNGGEDEVEDLYELLSEVKAALPSVQAVSAGAILSDYQRTRVENVCGRLGLTSLAYLWRRDQKELLGEMIACRLDPVIIKVASMGLSPEKHLGRSLCELAPALNVLASQCQLNVCGEGGEYETFTLDCPLFTRRLVLDATERVTISQDPFAPVAHLQLTTLHTEEKPASEVQLTSVEMAAAGLPLTTRATLMTDLEASIKAEITACRPPMVGDEDIGQGRRDGVKLEVLGNFFGWMIPGVQDSVFSVAKAALKAMTSALADSNRAAVYCLVCVCDMSWFSEVNRAYAEVFPAQDPPPRACIQVAAFPSVGPMGAPILSISCLVPSAVDPLVDITREVLHVRSLSHWAPANIGPYSQALRLVRGGCEEVVLVSGQIGMLPEDLSMIEEPRQAIMSLRHTNRVLQAIADHSLYNLDCAICYGSSESHLRQARDVFHDVICDDTKCSCDRVIWCVVGGLPKGAVVEWQVISRRKCSTNENTGTSAIDSTEISTNGNTDTSTNDSLVGGIKIMPFRSPISDSILLNARNSMFLYGVDNERSFSQDDIKNDFILIPVKRFLDESITCVVCQF